MAIPVAAPQRPAQVHAPHHASENREGQVDEVSNRDNPRYTRAGDYSWGQTKEELERALQTWIERGFRGDYTTPQWRRWIGPAYADDPAFIEQWDRIVRGSATPQARIQLARMNGKIDVRDIAPSVRVPTLFICKRDDPTMPVDCARDVTSRIPAARLVVMEGTGHYWGDGDRSSRPRALTTPTVSEWSSPKDSRRPGRSARGAGAATPPGGAV